MAHRVRVVSGVAGVCWLGLVLVFGCAHGVTDRFDDDSLSLSGPGCTDSTTTTTSTATSTSGTTTTTTTTTTTSTWSTTSTTTGGSACDTQGDCYACANCSTAGVCAADADACLTDVDCQDLLGCLETCFDQVCADDCASAYPAGAQLYMQLTQCAFCDACPVDCALENQGLCSP